MDGRPALRRPVPRDPRSPEIPQDHTTDDGFRLGAWIRNRVHRPHTLTEAQHQILDGLDPFWRDLDLFWRRQFALARSYRAEHGHLRIPRTHTTDDGVHLGEWLHAQRSRRTHLSDRQRDLLESINMEWDALSPREAAWQRGLAAARRHHAAHGHVQVPQSYVDDEGFGLGTWVSNQRRRHTKHAPERIAQLTAIGIL